MPGPRPKSFKEIAEEILSIKSQVRIGLSQHSSPLNTVLRIKPRPAILKLNENHLFYPSRLLQGLQVDCQKAVTCLQNFLASPMRANKLITLYKYEYKLSYKEQKPKG